MRQIAFAPFALAVLVCARCCTAIAEPAAETLRVGSYNIRQSHCDIGSPNAWDRRRADLVKLVRKINYDVVGLQEVNPDQAAYIAKALPEFKMVCTFRNADRKSGEASPVCYRADRFAVVKSGTFWLSETPDRPGSKSWGAACPRICTWALLEDRRTRRRFCFANTHTDHVSELARKEGMLLVIRRMRKFAPAGTPLVFTGDHNCWETDAPSIAVSKLLKNALYCAPKPKVSGTWRTFNGFKWRDGETSAADALKLGPKARNKDCGSRIDFIYVSPGIKVASYATHPDPRPKTKLYPSDHFPLSAVVELPKSAVLW